MFRSKLYNFDLSIGRRRKGKERRRRRKMKFYDLGI